MCSILKYKNVVGRNFDYEISYQEEARVVERDEFNNKYKVVGMCTGLVQDYPLLYDGINEKGLVCGALAFTGNAVYNNKKEGMINIPSYDFVFRILSNFRTVDEVKNELDKINISNEQYSKEFPNSDLHWFISDREKSIIIEQTEEGLDVYDGDVMTNNPPYYLQKNNCASENFTIGYNAPTWLPECFNSRGNSTFGLKGDYTSMGRFQRLTYLKNNLEKEDKDFDAETQAFHLLSSVEQIYGNTPVYEKDSQDVKYEYTIYSVVYDMNKFSMHLRKYNTTHVYAIGVYGS